MHSSASHLTSYLPVELPSAPTGWQEGLVGGQFLTFGFHKYQCSQVVLPIPSRKE